MGRGAKGQLFYRNQYLVVGLAPLVVITLAGISFTLVSPALASYCIFATAGNISGAAGDLWAVQRLLRLPHSILVEDTEAGLEPGNCPRFPLTIQCQHNEVIANQAGTASSRRWVFVLFAAARHRSHCAHRVALAFAVVR